jgi:hypothetical protein
MNHTRSEMADGAFVIILLHAVASYKVRPGMVAVGDTITQACGCPRNTTPRREVLYASRQQTMAVGF